MPAFTTPTDIGNRAIQRCGGNRIASPKTLFTATSKEATEIAACYNSLREAELRRNIWRFSIRRSILRPVGTALPDWDSTVTYDVGAYVTYGGDNYVALLGTNLDQQPDTSPTYWELFTGNTSQKIVFDDWSSLTTYAAYKIVQATDGYLYMSVVASNLNHDPTTDYAGAYWQLYYGNYVATAYDEDTTYNIGELVFDLANVVYYSTIQGNENDPSTGTGWVAQSGTVSPIVIPWPAGTGPAVQTATRNVFVLPYGFLREAPQDPRAGDVSTLGFPSNLPRNDWVIEGDYLISQVADPIMFRFAADITLVSKFDALFCEGLATRIAYEVCETLTNSNTKIQAIGGAYKVWMGTDARTVNGIETGTVQPPLDDFIACRY